MRRALLYCAAIIVAIACGDYPTETVPDRTPVAPAAVKSPLIAFATTTTEDGLSISTDKDDYQPGDVVHLTGSGWQGGDVLDVILVDNPQTHDPIVWSVDVAADGMFHDSTYVVDAGDLDVAFTLTATSRGTGRSLTVQFTDANISNNVTVTPGTISVVRGSDAVYTVTVNFGGNGAACNAPLTVTGLPLGATGTFNPTSVSGSPNDTRVSVLTVATTATGPTTTPAGTSTFTVRAAASGSGCDGNDRTATGVLVVSGPATKLLFGVQPTNRVSTQAFSPDLTVRVLDAANNLVGSSSASIDLAIGTNPSAGVLSGVISLNAVNGVATFSGVSIDKIGTGYTLAASSGLLSGAISAPFNITLGAANKLAFTTQPNGGPPNTAFTSQPVVTVQDAGGNTLTSGTGSTATVTLAILGGTGTAGAVLTCTTNPRNAVAGVDAFAGCRINLAGTNYQLRATSGSLTQATSNAFNIVVNNQPPVLALIGNKSIAEETELSFTATATDENVPSLQFSLANPATGTFPTGALITTGGVFTWTPSEAQGPGIYRVKVVVTDNGTLTDDEEIQITVTEVNRAPAVTAIPDQEVNEEAALTFTATATDPDLPANTLAFSLQAGTDPVPAGASIDGSTGVFSWTPTEAQGPGVYNFKVRATDNGSPVLFGEADVKVTVKEVNRAPVLDAIGNKSVNEGSELTFTATASDPDLPPNTLTFSLDGAPAGATINGSTGAFSWTPADDDPTGTPSDDKTFKVVVKDNGTPQLVDDETITVTVNNVDPVVDAGDDQTGDEGETLQLHGSFDDPGADTHTWTWEYAEGFHDAATCHITDATTSLDPTINCNDDGTVYVTLTVKDDDLGEGSDQVELTIENVAPAASALNTNSPVNEGSDIVLSLAGVTDPSSIDFASLHYAFDCGSGYSATTYDAAGATNSANCPTNDNGTRSVKGKVFDKDGGFSTDYSATVTIENVAPTATFNAPSPVNEGSSIALSLTDPHDPSSADVTAGFKYAFDCGDGTGYSAFGTTSSHSCPTNDNGSRSVGGKIQDKDGGTTGYTATVTIDNVAPTATFNAPASVNEGSNIALSLSGPFDPSSADETAGFEYAFDCGDGAGYGAFGSTASRSCPTTDNGTRSVKGRIRDKDLGVSEYTGSVVVANVPPVILSWTKLDGSALPTFMAVGGTLDFRVTFTDVGTGDTHKAEIDCGQGANYVALNGPGDDTSPFQSSCTFPSIGSKTIKVKVTDDDGGVDEETRNITVGYNFAGFFAPVDRPNTMNVSKAGQAIPLKWRLTDAFGRPVTDVTSVTVQSVGIPCGTSTNTDTIEEYAAGNSGLQNLGDGNYQFNWKTPNTYAGSCKSIALVFGAGALSYIEGPHAFFSFKK